MLSNANGDTTFPITVTASTPDPYFSGASYYYNRINNSGIGTAVPIERLDVAGDIRVGGQATTYYGLPVFQAMLSLYNYNYGIAKFTNLGTRIFTKAGDDIQLGNISPETAWPFSGGGVPYQVTEANFLPRLTIETTGKVGIGTTAPGAKLTVIADSPVGTTSENSTSMFKITTGAGGRSLYMSYDGVANVGFIEASHTGSLDPLILNPRGGNVGIGTSAPSSTLHVEGSERVAGSLAVDGYLGIGTTAPAAALTLIANSPAASTYEHSTSMFKITTGSNAQSLYMTYDGVSQSGVIAASHNGGVDSLLLNPRGGYVGIGTTTPGATLHVAGTLNISGAAALGSASIGNLAVSGIASFSGLTSVSGSLIVSNGFAVTHGGNTSNMYIAQNNNWGVNGALTGDLLITSNHRILMVSETSQVQSGVYLPGGGTSWSSFSDRRLKRDIKPIENALERLLEINGYTYNYKTDHLDVPRRVGVIAQEVQSVLPEAVSVDSDGILGVKYTELIPLLVHSLKEFHNLFLENTANGNRAISTLQSENKVLQSENKRFRDRLDHQSAALCELGKKSFCN